MNKFVAFVLILIIPIILVITYGVIHDQITYSILEEYYSKFKFVQFNFENWDLGYNIGTEINPEIKLQNARFGAGIVGAFSTWWMGLIIGLIFAFVGLVHRNGREIFKSTIQSFVLTIVTAFLVGIIGLGFGKFFLTNNLPSWNLPENLVDVDSFVMVGSMYNFSYLGGFIVTILGIIYTIKLSKRLKNNNIKTFI